MNHELAAQTAERLLALRAGVAGPRGVERVAVERVG